MDYDQIAAEWARALRGRRSQIAFSKRLGFRSNVAYAWESGRAFPTAASFFRILDRLGRKPENALARFDRRQAGSTPHDLRTTAGVAAFLDDLRGQTAIVDLASSAGRSRFAVARWLKGDAQPRLPDFLRLVEKASLRLFDFLACFIEPSSLPSVATAWRVLEDARRAAYELPWSHAVLRVIELADYQALRQHQPGFIANRLQISVDDEKRCVSLLLATGQLRRVGRRLVVGAALTVDTRTDHVRSQKLKAFWAKTAVARLEEGADGLFSYNLFSVSRADFERIQELYRGYFRELRRIVAASEPSECIVLANMQMLEFGVPSRS